MLIVYQQHLLRVGVRSLNLLHTWMSVWEYEYCVLYDFDIIVSQVKNSLIPADHHVSSQPQCIVGGGR